MNTTSDNRYVFDVPGAPVQQETEEMSPDRVETGLIGLQHRDSLMEDTVNLKDHEYHDVGMKPINGQYQEGIVQIRSADH